MRFRPVLKQALILVGLAVVLALFDSAVRPAATFASQSPEPFPVITGAAALESFARNDRVFVDARSRDLFAAGHIPGAFLVDTHRDFESGYAAFAKVVPLDQPLVIYCEDKFCQLSAELAMKLSERGYSKIALFKGGWAEWTAANGPSAKGDH